MTRFHVHGTYTASISRFIDITRKVVDDHVETLMWNWVENIGDLEQGDDNDLD
jgi:hypothetical protein